MVIIKKLGFMLHLTIIAQSQKLLFQKLQLVQIINIFC